MTNVMRYAGNQGSNAPNTSRTPSPFLWQDCPWREIVDGTVDGVAVFDDFVYGGAITSPTTEAALVGIPWSGFGSSGSTITYDKTAQGGGAIVLSETTTQEGVVLRALQAPFQISANAGSFWFECRLKPLLTDTNEMGFFAGLIDTTAASATSPITMSTGALADVNLIGFHKPVANTTLFDFSYKADGVTAVELVSDTGTLAANTYIKLGFKYSQSTGRLTPYVNGVRVDLTAAESSTVSTRLGKLVPNNTGTDMPSDVALGVAIAMFVGSAASDNTLTVDWVRAAQLGYSAIAAA